jgi:hypothetical protein
MGVKFNDMADVKGTDFDLNRIYIQQVCNKSS